METIVTRREYKRGKKQYEKCVRCGAEKLTIKQRYSKLCASCGREVQKRDIVDGKQQCTQCKEWKPLSEFYKQKSLTHGIRPDCKKCADKRISKCHSVVPLLKRLWARISYHRNKDKSKVTAKIYRENHKEEIAKRHKEYQEKNKELIQQKQHDYYMQNPSKAMERLRKRKARIRGGGGVFTESDWCEVLERYGSACLRCGATDNIVKDHVIPLSKGGRNDKFNIQPLCGHCNSTKFTRDWDFRFDKGSWK